MRVLAKTTSAFSYWEALLFLEAALMRDDRTAHLSADVTEIIEEFMKVLRLDMETRRKRIQAYAHSSMADAVLDGTIRDIQSATLHATRQDRQAPAYTTLFRENISRMVRHALAKQVEVAQTLYERLALSVVPEAVRAHSTTLEAAVSKGRVVLDERRKALLERAQARITIDEWKEEANAVRLSVFSQLGDIAAKNRLGRDWPDAFFPAAPDRDEPRDTPVDADLPQPVAPLAEA